MRTFTIRLLNGTIFTVHADFLTREVAAPGHIRLWSKPHWYSRRRCIGIVDWQTVASASTAATSDELAHELGVKL